eukprot:XP_001700306.1 predicted protein [Chlamydomonas reinhardtii]
MEEGQALVAGSASRRALWLAELKALGALALPVVLQTSAQQGLVVTDQIFLGHLGTAELGAAAIANSYTNLMWFFLLGFATALDTLGSNAYGAGDRRALVTWCVTAALLVTVLVGPVAVGMSLGGLAASSMFGQDARTSDLMGRFCVGLIPGMWPLMWGIVLTKYLQVQNVMAAPSVIAVLTFLMNIAFNAILVRELGFRGAPLATTLSRWAQCRAAVAPGVILRFCKLGIPGGLSMAFEVGCFEFSTILAAALGPAITAAHAAMLSLVALTYLACPFALATAGAIRVGNLLGSGQPEPARRSGLLAIALSGGFMALMAVGLLASRSVLGRAFSSDPQVVGVIRDLTLFAALFQVSDGLMGSSQGVLRGCGHQHLTAVFNFIGFWVFGVLLGYLLCFKAHLGIFGLWTGIASGDSATAVLNLVAISRIKWRKEADQAVHRLQALAKQAEELQALVKEASVLQTT